MWSLIQLESDRSRIIVEAAKVISTTNDNEFLNIAGLKLSCKTLHRNESLQYLKNMTMKDYQNGQERKSFTLLDCSVTLQNSCGEDPNSSFILSSNIDEKKFDSDCCNYSNLNGKTSSPKTPKEKLSNPLQNPVLEPQKKVQCCEQNSDLIDFSSFEDNVHSSSKIISPNVSLRNVKVVLVDKTNINRSSYKKSINVNNALVNKTDVSKENRKMRSSVKVVSKLKEFEVPEVSEDDLANVINIEEGTQIKPQNIPFKNSKASVTGFQDLAVNVTDKSSNVPLIDVKKKQRKNLIDDSSKEQSPLIDLNNSGCCHDIPESVLVDTTNIDKSTQIEIEIGNNEDSALQSDISVNVLEEELNAFEVSLKNSEFQSESRQVVIVDKTTTSKASVAESGELTKNVSDNSLKVPKSSIEEKVLQIRQEKKKNPIPSKKMVVKPKKGIHTSVCSDKNDSDYTANKSMQSDNSKGSITVNISKEYDVEKNNNNKGKGKKYFCPYCKKKISKFARHLEQKHRKEQEVQNFLAYSKSTIQRADAIALIRNKGMVIHNSEFKYHKGKLISARRPNTEKKMKSTALEVCPDCLGTYTVCSIKNHVCKSSTTKEKFPVKTRERLNRGRAKFLHCNEGLSDRLRKEIIPSIQNQQYANIISSDHLILKCGESFCDKYPESRQNPMICGYLRAYANFLTAIKEIEPRITDFESVMRTHFYKSTVLAIKKVAGFRKGGYDHPGTATSLTMLIKKAVSVNECDILMSESAEVKNKLTDVQGYAKLCQDRFGGDVNKLANTTYLKNKQNMQVELVSTEDIEKLDIFLEKKREDALKKLNEMKDIEDLESDTWCEEYYSTWRELAEATLIGTMHFNRKRAGETERIEIADFQKLIKITKSHPTWKTLSSSEKTQASLYGRFEVVGKLYKTVPILLDKHFSECFRTIIKFRKLAKVRDTNPYVFGLPNKNVNKDVFIRACDCMRKFSTLCGASKPHLLRGTIMRKHLATESLNDGATGNEVAQISKFMGHRQSIHENVYQQNAVSDIVRVSKHLEKVSGRTDKRKNTKTKVAEEPEEILTEESIGTESDHFSPELTRNRTRTINNVISDESEGDTTLIDKNKNENREKSTYRKNRLSSSDDTDYNNNSLSEDDFTKKSIKKKKNYKRKLSSDSEGSIHQKQKKKKT